MRAHPFRILPFPFLLAAGGGDGDEPRRAQTATDADSAVVETPWSDSVLTPEELEPGRLDPSWREVAQLDSAAMVDTARNPERWEDLSAKAVIREHTLTADEVAGPFVEIPGDIYEQAKLECSCYESLSEKLGERFHVTPELLAKLNPGVSLDALRAGDRLRVPAIRDPNATGEGQVAEIVVSVRGHYLHANDARGRLLYHCPHHRRLRTRRGMRPTASRASPRTPTAPTPRSRRG